MLKKITVVVSRKHRSKTHALSPTVSNIDAVDTSCANRNLPWASCDSCPPNERILEASMLLLCPLFLIELGHLGQTLLGPLGFDLGFPCSFVHSLWLVAIRLR